MRERKIKGERRKEIEIDRWKCERVREIEV